MSITKSDRVAILVVYLETGGQEEWQVVYELSEPAAILTVSAELTSVYKRVIILEKENTTEQKFIKTLSELAVDATVKAIDVIFVLHGWEEKLWFYNTKVPVARLKYQISCLNLRRKLRLLYSAACYGATHADDFVAAGFDCASGALGVTTNGDLEFPNVIDALQDGRTHKKGIEEGSEGLEERDEDSGVEGANSKKIIVGNGDITINSTPTFGGKAYFFKDGQYIRWDLKKDTVDEGYPHASSQYWAELVPKIDAAVTWNNDKIYFFKGKEYYRWDLKTDTADADYPQPISPNWNSFMADGVDAAVNWTNNKVYFFKGKNYVLYDVTTDAVKEGYPQPISKYWHPFMANGVDAAINWGDGKAYFFKGEEYIRWDIAADKIDDNYPQRIDLRWHSFMAKGVDAAFLWLR